MGTKSKYTGDRTILDSACAIVITSGEVELVYPKDAVIGEVMPEYVQFAAMIYHLFDKPEFIDIVNTAYSNSVATEESGPVN